MSNENGTDPSVHSTDEIRAALGKIPANADFTVQSLDYSNEIIGLIESGEWRQSWHFPSCLRGLWRNGSRLARNEPTNGAPTSGANQWTEASGKMKKAIGLLSAEFDLSSEELLEGITDPQSTVWSTLIDQAASKTQATND